MRSDKTGVSFWAAADLAAAVVSSW